MGWYNRVTSTVPFAQRQISARQVATAEKKGDIDTEKMGTAPADLLTRFLNAKSDYPEVVDDRAVLGLTLSMVNAGSGTIATTLAATIYYLLKYPEKMEKLMQELDHHFPPPETAIGKSFEEWVVPFTEAQKLPYLDACIKETFRIHPALGAQLLERVTPPEGAHIAGEYIRGGIIVTSNAWIVHRHKPTYGEDVETYRPERWIDCDSGQLAAMNRSSLVFGAGPNTCIGKSIGLLELYKMIPTILRMFTIELVDPQSSWKIYNLGDPEPYDFYVRFKSRYN
jgi:cytochrome P450